MSEKITILYIEDNLHNRVLVRRVLEAADYQIIEAENGFSGLALAQTHHPQLIIVDINLPDIDGYDVTERLRQMPNFKATPILAMTANVMKGDREKTLSAGCNGYIQKPIDIDLLPLQIAEYLQKVG